MQKYPVIKFILFFSIGILFQNFVFISPQILLIIFSLTLFILLIVVLYYKKSSNEIANKRWRNIYYFPILFCSIIFGAIYFSFFVSNSAHYPFKLPKIRNSKIVGEIKRIDLLKEKKLVVELEIHSLNEKIIKQDFSDKFLCNFLKDSTNSVSHLYNRIKIGNVIAFKGTVKRAKNRRNPGEFNYEEYLNKQGIAGTINCYNFDELKIINTKADIIANTIFTIRKSIDERIKELHNPETSALLKGILLADRSDIDYNIKNSFINSGVIHVLAVSGLHVGFISLIFFLLLGRVRIELRYILTIFGIILFLILTGAHASVFRASTMAIIYLIAKLTNRSTNGFNSIAIAALIILLIDPQELFNPGFLLSFSAVISILIIYPIFSEKINQFKIKWFYKKLLLFISVSLAAQLGTLPFTLVYFNKLSVVSLFANLIVVPLIGIIVGLGILTLVVSVISFQVALIFAGTNQFLVGLLFFFTNWVGNLKFSFIPIYNITILDGLFYFLFLSIIIYSFINFKNKVAFILVIIFSIFSFNFFVQIDDKSLLPSNKLSVVTIDVGQGDSFLIKFPNNKVALIDAGNLTEYFDVGERIILPLLNRLQIDKIDYAFISHLDFDHFGGSIYLINKDVINNLHKPISDSSVKDIIYEDFLKANDVKISYYSANSLEIGGAKLYFLNDTTFQKQNNFDSNNNSGIIKIVYGNTSFLFVGDAEWEAEEFLVNKYGEFLHSDVLKIGHHGSKTSTSEKFIDSVKPKIGIISAGIMNKFKHPSKSVMEELRDRNILVRRTDNEGAIILCSDGSTIKNIDWRNF